MDLVLAAARDLHRVLPELAAFGAWPEDLRRADHVPLGVPACDQIAGFAHAGTALTQPMIEDVRRSVPAGHWVQTYTEAEVGAHFLQNYGYYELFGPGGHFTCSGLRGFVAYWGASLDYGWHRHAAEELYVILGGEAWFVSETGGEVLLRAGETRFHAGNEGHAMRTGDAPVLTYVVWRGDGLEDLPRMDVG